MSWWVNAQRDGTFYTQAEREWQARMRYVQMPRLTSEDVKRPARKFDQGSTFIARTRLDERAA